MRGRTLSLLLAMVVVAACAPTPHPAPLPTPQPGPLPTPTPGPVPIPGPGACPVGVDASHFVELVVGMIGSNPRQWSATPKYCGFPLRDDIFAVCGTKCCTLGVDGVDHQHPEDKRNPNAIECEAGLSGPPKWLHAPLHTTDFVDCKVPGPLSCMPAFDNNPYNVKVPAGSGLLRACGKSGCSVDVVFP